MSGPRRGFATFDGPGSEASRGRAPPGSVRPGSISGPGSAAGAASPSRASSRSRAPSVGTMAGIESVDGGVKVARELPRDLIVPPELHNLSKFVSPFHSLHSYPRTVTPFALTDTSSPALFYLTLGEERGNRVLHWSCKCAIGHDDMFAVVDEPRAGTWELSISTLPLLQLFSSHPSFPSISSTKTATTYCPTPQNTFSTIIFQGPPFLV